MKSKFFILIGLFVSNCLGLQVFNLHINGINTTKSQAYDNLINLRSISNVNSNIVKWDLVYNPSSENPEETNFLSNISDTIQQKNAELSLDDYTKIYIKSFNLSEELYSEGSPKYMELQKNLVAEYNKVLSYKGVNFDTIVSNFNQSTDYIFDAVTTLLTTNNKDKENTFVLLIPHSQGNLYANSLYDYLIEKNLIKKENILEFGIATPASSMRSSDIYNNLCIPTKYYWESDGFIQEYVYDKCWYQNYLNDSHDRVISDLVSFLYSDTKIKPLPANNTNKNNEVFGLNHNLIDFYLSPDENDENSSTYKIKAGIWEAMIYFQNLLKIKSVDRNSKYSVFNLQTQDNIKHIGQTTRLLNNENKIICDRLECFNSSGYIENNFLNIGLKYEKTYIMEKEYGDYRVLTNYEEVTEYHPNKYGNSYLYIYQNHNNHIYTTIGFNRNYDCIYYRNFNDSDDNGFNVYLHAVTNTHQINNAWTSCYTYPFLFENNELILETFSTQNKLDLLKTNKDINFKDFYKSELNIINERKKITELDNEFYKNN